MSRPSACADPTLWPSVVLQWIDRRVAKSGIKLHPPKPLTRFLHELNTHIRRAKDGSVTSASAIVGYFYCVTREERRVDSRVEGFLEYARHRYCRDPKHNIGKALRLTRTARGNPGGVSKRRLTPDGRREVALYVRAQMRDKHTYEEAVATTAQKFRVSLKSVKRYYADWKRETPEEFNPALRPIS